MADSVQLTDLDVIARYSIAVRSATADRDELLETLRADVAWLERGRSRSSTSAFRSAEAEGADDEAADYEEPETLSRPKRTTSAKRTSTRRAPRA